MLTSIHIPPSTRESAMLTGSWSRERYWDWNGTITFSEPIVALSFMQVETRLDWVRSEKGPKSELEVRLLLSFDAPDRSNVCSLFGIGDCVLRRWTLLKDPDKPPKSPERRSVPLGRVFPFCAPFGSPAIHLYGLVLQRSQAVGARIGLWHLKRKYCEGLTDTWAHVLSHGRSGFILPEHET